VDTEHIAMLVCLGVAAVVVLTSVLAPVCRRLGQPVVVGQILVGVALGALPRQLTRVVFPPVSLPFLMVISQIGLVLFLFCVGYEVDVRWCRARRRSVLAVSAGGFLAPMLLGGALAWLICGAGPWARTAGTARGPFLLFVAVAMSITALPVLASIIRERGLVATAPGGVALASAGLLDVIGWILLTVAVASAHAGAMRADKLLIFLPGYLLGMLLVVRPALRRWMRSPRSAGIRRETAVVALVLVSACCTELMGLQLLFGALLVGLLMPRLQGGGADPGLLRAVEKTGSILLPVFFVVTGMSVRLGAMTKSYWILLAVVCAVAVAGKLGGSALAARASSMRWRDSLIVGALMNTRGLTELIVINAGWRAGIIGRPLYTVLVLMALITTALTGPLLALLRASALPAAVSAQVITPAVPAAGEPASRPDRPRLTPVREPASSVPPR
jgi:Kef-type K+ transport system membrane component KefB